MKKNRYVRLFIILLITIVITILVCNLYRNYENNKLNKSYLSKYVTNISLKDLSNSIVETGDNTFIYFGVTGSDDIYRMEKELKRIIVNNHLEDDFLHIDATKMTVSDVNDLLNSDKKIQKFPAIVYLKNGSVTEVLDSSMHSLNSSDFDNLLDTYEVKK